MPGAQSDNPVDRVVRSVSATKWSTKAKAVAASLKAQHAAGRDGDDSPAEPIWPTPREQLEALKRLLRVSQSQAPAATFDPADLTDDPSSTEPAAGDAADTDAEEVAAALRGVNWTEVRNATSGKANDVTKAMRAMSDQVDWAKVQPVAAQLSTALIAAVAAGRIPVGGRLGPIVAKAIVDQNNLAGRVAQNLERSQAAAPPDFREIIDATATEL
jgi:hypothetical protein